MTTPANNKTLARAYKMRALALDRKRSMSHQKNQKLKETNTILTIKNLEKRMEKQKMEKRIWSRAQLESRSEI